MTDLDMTPRTRACRSLSTVAALAAGALLACSGCASSPRAPTSAVARQANGAGEAQVAAWRAWDQVQLGARPLSRSDRTLLASRIAPEDPLAEARALLRGEQPILRGVPSALTPSAIGGGPSPAIDDAAMRKIAE